MKVVLWGIFLISLGIVFFNMITHQFILKHVPVEILGIFLLAYVTNFIHL
ncbi:hypothetical protein HMPREF0496_2903, partial [Lentilactobacillus hilgardii ATCC 27305]